ncbi:MAG: PRC-barrel domain-containing protein [Rhodospirillales bacterium]|nr:PRC-barrel domain-containing protein [Rhodospirillales bacterium]
MKKQTLFGTLLSAAIITVSGVAIAQQSGAGAGTGQMPNQAAPMTPGSGSSDTMPRKSGDMTAPSSNMPGQAASPSAMPPETVVGKSVVNAEGEEIGEISKIAGNQVIVEVGGFLGIGARDVALDWSQVSSTGMGDDMKLQTTLTKEELEAMPEYKE